MISKVTLNNFRCFQEFTLDGIKPITLIAGTNNVGKSTILESIFLFMDRNSGDVFLKLNAFRGITLFTWSPQMVWEPLFSDLTTENKISICLTNDNEEQTVVLSKDTSFSLTSIQATHLPLPLNIPGIGTPLANNYPLKLNYIDKKQNEIAYFTISAAGITFTPQKPITTITPYIHYFSSKLSANPNQIAECFGQIEITGGKSKSVEILQLLDNRIKDLSVVVIGGINGIFADIGLKSRLSINMLGDGINKLLHIILIMLANPGSVVLIDEIENGFHYSFYPKLWEIIKKLAIETKCQIIATSHSYECINAASILADDSELFRFVRLEEIEGEIVPNIFDNDSFAFAVKNELEVR